MHITFLLTDEVSGKGGLEKVLIEITQGLKEYKIYSKILFIHAPEHNSFLKNFEQTAVMDKVSKKKGSFPKFLDHQFWKFRFSIATRKFLKKNLFNEKTDALIILNLSKDLLRITPTLKKFSKRYPTTPIISWAHSSLSILDKKIIYALKNTINIFSSHFAISTGLKKELINNLDAQNIKVIYNPIESALLIPRNHHKFTYIGRVNAPEKQVKELLHILSQLKGHWHLDLIGLDSDPQKNQVIMNNISILNLHKNISLHEWCEDPWSLIKNTGVLLLNSKVEGFGLVLVEAMMRGIPCVSADCPVGPAEIIQNNTNGWLYKPYKPEECVTILQSIIDGSRILPKQTHIVNSVQRFSKPIVIQKFKDSLIESIKERKTN